MTLLLYAERPRDQSFHDYVAVITTSLPGPDPRHVPAASPAALTERNLAVERQVKELLAQRDGPHGTVVRSWKRSPRMHAGPPRR